MERPSTPQVLPHSDLVMFDFDGTVVDSLETYTEALLEACRQCGVTAITTPPDVLALFAGNFFDGLRERGLDEATIAAVNRRAADAYVAALDRLLPFPGMTQVLSELSATHHIAVVTSNSGETVATCLRHLGVPEAADVLGAERGLGKVAKITGLMARFANGTPSWFVGDTTGDMREARLAGAEPLGVAWGWHAPAALRAAGAARIAATPAELLAIIAPAAAAPTVAPRRPAAAER